MAHLKALVETGAQEGVAQQGAGGAGLAVRSESLGPHIQRESIEAMRPTRTIVVMNRSSFKIDDGRHDETAPLKRAYILSGILISLA